MPSTVDSSKTSGLAAVESLVDDRALPRLIAERLAHSIVDGTLSPGQRIAETDVAELFGTSRTPVREAFQLLSHDGLIELIPRRGARVIQLSAEDVHGAYVGRVAVMGLVSRLAAIKMATDDRQTLIDLCDTMEEQIAGDDLKMFFDSCVEFGDMILTAADTDQLIQLARTLRGASAFSLDQVAEQPQRASTVLGCYRDVAAAIQRSAPAEAELAMRTVVAEFGDWLIATQFQDVSTTLPTIMSLIAD